MKDAMRYLQISMLAAGVLLTAACAAAAGGRTGAAAAHVWPEGTTVTYTITSSQSQTVEMPGYGEQTSNSSTTIDVTVTAVGPRRFSVTVTDASTVSDNPPSGDEPDINLLIGMECTFSLDERGEIVEATGLEENGYVRDAGGVESFREEYQGLFLILPEGGLEAGVEWTREYGFTANQMNMMSLEFTMKDHYTCVEETVYEGTAAWKIAVRSEASVSGSGDAEGTPIDLSFSGTGEGAVYVATGTAMVLGAESESTLQGGASVMGMDLPLTVRTTGGLTRK